MTLAGKGLFTLVTQLLLPFITYGITEAHVSGRMRNTFAANFYQIDRISLKIWRIFLPMLVCTFGVVLVRTIP